MVSVAFVTTESDLDQCLFTLDDAFFPTAHEGKRFLDCVWVRLLKDHMQKRSYLMCSPYYLWGVRQNLEGIGEAATHGTKRLHTKEDNIMPIVNG